MARFPRVDSGLFRDPASLAGLRGARGGARYAFDPWTKLPVRIECVDRTADSEPRGTTTGVVGVGVGPTGVRAIARLIIRNRIKWCWHVASPSWWVAFFYLLGSVGFAAGGFASCLNAVAGSRRRYFVFEVAPYTCGGLAFLIATALLVYTSWTARYGEPGRAERRRVAKRHAFLSNVSVFRKRFFSVKRLETSVSSSQPSHARTNARPHASESALPPSFWELRAAVGERGVVGDPLTQPLMDADVSELYGLSDAMEEARRLWLANDSWTRRRRALELVSSGLILLGVLLYKVMVFTMFARCAFPGSIPWSAKRELFLYTAPSVVGSLFFVAGSYVLWCAVNRTFPVRTVRTRTVRTVRTGYRNDASHQPPSVITASFRVDATFVNTIALTRARSAPALRIGTITSANSAFPVTSWNNRLKSPSSKERGTTHDSHVASASFVNTHAAKWSVSMNTAPKSPGRAATAARSARARPANRRRDAPTEGSRRD